MNKTREARPLQLSTEIRNPMNESTGSRSDHNLLQQQAFDEVAEGFGQPIPEDVLQRLQSVVEMAGIAPGESVLDVGTGAGVLIPFILQRRPSRVAACDLSGEMLQLASGRYGDKVTFLQSDVVDVPAELGPFNAVFCNAMFGNVFDQRQTVEAIENLLAVSGRLVISHPMGRDFVRRLKAGSPQYNLKELPDEPALVRLVNGTGLSVTRYVDEPDLYVAICAKTAFRPT